MSSTPTPNRAGAGAPSVWSGPLRPVMAASASLLACGLASQGGWLAMAATVCGTCACALLARQVSAGSLSTQPASSPEFIDARLPSTVVPVWRKQLELAREHSNDSMSKLMSSFAELSMHLDKAVQAVTHLTPDDTRDFVENVLQDNESNVEALAEPMRDAYAAKRKLSDHTHQLRTWMGELLKLAQEVKALARHTNLVALNASIEANRAGTSGRSFSIVADEVRSLAAQSGETGERIQSKVATIELAVHELQDQMGQESDSDEASLLESQNQARRVMAQLLGSASRMADSSRELRDATRAVQSEIDQLMVSLQHQDRLSQMLDSIAIDMGRFETWLSTNEGSSAAHVTDWLHRLESSYTTQEQRAEHHGVKAVSQSSGVDFF